MTSLGPNLIPNSTNVGAAVGTPGTLPNDWTVSNALGGASSLTRSVVGFGNDAGNGVPYIDVRLTGTTSGTQADIFVSSSVPSLVSGGFSSGFSSGFSGRSSFGAYTFSIYAAIVGGSLSNISATFINFDAFSDSGGNTYISTPAVNQITITGALTRFSVTATMPAGTLLAKCYLPFQFPNGVAIDVTFRIGGVQMEHAPTPSIFQTTPGYNPTAFVNVGQIAPMMAR